MPPSPQLSARRRVEGPQRAQDPVLRTNQVADEHRKTLAETFKNSSHTNNLNYQKQFVNEAQRVVTLDSAALLPLSLALAISYNSTRACTRNVFATEGLQ